MWHSCPELQQYVLIAADRHRRLLAEAAAHRQVACLGRTQLGYWRFLCLAVGGLLLLARPAGGRPKPASPARTLSI